DDRVEAVDAVQLPLPANQRFHLARLLQRQPMDRVLGDDSEQGHVDGVDALAQDGALAAALAARRFLYPAQERAGVLEVVARDDPADGLARQQRLAVPGVDIADLALR